MKERNKGRGMKRWEMGTWNEMKWKRSRRDRLREKGSGLRGGRQRLGFAGMEVDCGHQSMGREGDTELSNGRSPLWQFDLCGPNQFAGCHLRAALLVGPPISWHQTALISGKLVESGPMVRPSLVEHDGRRGEE